MSIRRRLEALEARTSATRCDVCRSWPDHRVVYLEDPYGSAPSATPERCARCGWEPVTIHVVYVDWPPEPAR